MNSFLTRVISAVVAATILLLVYYIFGKSGWQYAICFAVLVGTLELIPLLFKSDSALADRIIFYISVFATYIFSCLFFQWSSVIFAIASIVYCLYSLMTQKKFENLEQLSFAQAKSILGIFYLGLIPSFVYQILELPHGQIWFLTLLSIVFGGDIGAYLVGVKFGKHKIMPAVSPKKSVEGAIGGLVFSVVVGLVCSQFLPTVPKSGIFALSLVAAIVGQFGDFFESLLKRVADVKDSGKLMPGHGGVLDRIDGVLFASPIVFFGATLLENYFS